MPTTGASLEITLFQSEGVIMERFIGALRSGWSKAGNTLLAAYGSNWVYRYCF